jgi:glycosyltransferase involved in cell wall biosynthesis
MTKILWLSPNFNHYKARFLNHLGESEGIELTILTGSGRIGKGDKEIDGNWSFKRIATDVSKSKFGLASKIRSVLYKEFKSHDWILVPAEKKNLILLYFLLFLKFFFRKTKLVSYNHPILKSGNGIPTKSEIFITKLFYRKLDRVIFYTKEACEFAIENNLIASKKAFWANNTVDNLEISKFYHFSLPPKDKISILYIGRLIPSKRVGDIIEYFKVIDNRKPGLFELNIIGDGPDRAKIENLGMSNVILHGTMVDEKEIAPLMRNAACVFVPGLSGLSINHAFAYGRPYFTFESSHHGPEIVYLEHQKNGLILENKKDEDCELIFQLLTNATKIDEFCRNANEKGNTLSVEKWVEQMKNNFIVSI